VVGYETTVTCLARDFRKSAVGLAEIGFRCRLSGNRIPTAGLSRRRVTLLGHHTNSIIAISFFGLILDSVEGRSGYDRLHGHAAVSQQYSFIINKNL